MIQHLGKQKGLRGTSQINRNVSSHVCIKYGLGYLGSLMLADENFKSTNSIDMLLRTDVFFEVRRHDKQTRPRNYPILREKYLQQRLKEFQGNLPSFTIITTVIKNYGDFGKLKYCLIRQGQLKKFCMRDNSSSLPHEMKRDVTL